jgi:hypothetical protein
MRPERVSCHRARMIGDRTPNEAPRRRTGKHANHRAPGPSLWVPHGRGVASIDHPRPHRRSRRSIPEPRGNQAEASGSISTS